MLVAGLLIVGLVFLLGFGVALLIGGPILLVVDYVRKQRFLRRHAGQSFLIVCRRRGWRDFIVNNVVPALPAGASCIWDDSGEPSSDVLVFIRRRTRRRTRGLRRPYLVTISSNRRLEVIAMHDRLLRLKSQRQRSVETQRAVANIVATVIEG